VKCCGIQGCCVGMRPDVRSCWKMVYIAKEVDNVFARLKEESNWFPARAGLSIGIPPNLQKPN